MVSFAACNIVRSLSFVHLTFCSILLWLGVRANVFMFLMLYMSAIMLNFGSCSAASPSCLTLCVVHPIFDISMRISSMIMAAVSASFRFENLTNMYRDFLSMNSHTHLVPLECRSVDVGKGTGSKDNCDIISYGLWAASLAAAL